MPHSPALSGPCARDGYLIPEHVYLCRTREGVLFLNLRDDKYLGVTGEDLQYLQALVPGWPISWARCGAAEISERARQMARELQRVGLLTTDATRGKSAQPLTVEDGDSSLLQHLPNYRSRAAPMLLVRLVCAALTVAAVLKFRSLERAVRRVRLRKRGYGTHDDGAGVPSFAGLVTHFFRLRPLVYSSGGKCLYDCLVLLEFLSYFKLYPTLVIGVRTFPFNAHCWLQHGRLVLTDHTEHTRSYTPLLVV
jgi:hypothetical protein